MLTEDFVPITPVNFFELEWDCHYLAHGKPFALSAKNESHYRIPSTAELCDEESFADVSLSWSEDGIELYVTVRAPIQQALYPQVDEGDSVELFIDTRDVKTSGFNTKFCHHFFFLPESYEGISAGEVTRFRTEDMHELCDPKELKVKVHKLKEGYVIQGFIPAHCLVGYDPDQFKRMGMSYRINRLGFDPQHFSVITEDYAIEQQPMLWSHVNLGTVKN